MRVFFCPNCHKSRKIGIPSIEMVGYATTGRVYKCWKCGREMYISRETIKDWIRRNG